MEKRSTEISPNPYRLLPEAITHGHKTGSKKKKKKKKKELRGCDEALAGFQHRQRVNLRGRRADEPHISTKTIHPAHQQPRMATATHRVEPSQF